MTNQALIVIKDKRAANGIAHGIDSVLLPDHFRINRTHEHFKNDTIGTVLKQIPVFKSLWQAIKKVSLDKVLMDESSQITFFAPPDYVWGRGPFKELLEADENELSQVLKYHVIEYESIATLVTGTPQY